MPTGMIPAGWRVLLVLIVVLGVVFLMILLVCSCLVFLIWFGISIIRLRRKLGMSAAVTGWAILTSIVS